MDNITKRILLTPLNLLYRVDPALTLRILFRLKKHQRLNLRAPASYNEKLQWIKLYDKNPLFVPCCDKYLVRQYLEEKGVPQLLNTLYWQGFSPEDIPFDELPDKFVLKVTHGSAFNILCENKAALDREKTKKQLARWLREKYLPCYGEWFYGVEPPRIVAEKYLEADGPHGLIDYKLYCFGGVPRIVSVDYGRAGGAHYKDIYDPDWTLRRDTHMAYPCSNTPMEKPEGLQEMLRCAALLSKDFRHARVDFYLIEGRPVFGELTFTNGSGFNPIQPYAFDLEMGSWLELPLPK